VQSADLWCGNGIETIIHWFRRDLRLADNTALDAARRDSDGAVVPVFVLSQWHGFHGWTGAPRQDYLCASLRELASGLEALGSRLLFRRGDAERELERLLTETRAAAIYFNRDPDPFGRAVERRVEAMARRLGVWASGFDDVTAQPPETVRSAAGTPFRVFTPYARAWLRLPITAPRPRPVRLVCPPGLAKLPTLPPPTLAGWGLSATARILTPGESAARRRAGDFLAEAIHHYASERDCPVVQATSRLSADLRWGTISIRELAGRCRDLIVQAKSAAERSGPAKFLNELIWREFYMAVLHHWPEVLEREFQPQFRKLPWLYPGDTARRQDFEGSDVSPSEAFSRWCEGTTGFPIVDAGMRQLAETGWMHNRVRMIVAMFLTKDLHLDWRLGERFFMQRLCDGEIAANNGGWQWSAGTGADAAPYFRIQNPWKQTQSYDPDGAYIKRWVPELRECHPRQFARPPAPQSSLARGYPAPMVDHAREREVALRVFAKHRREALR